MAEFEVRVPEIGESINEVTLSAWLKEDGDYVRLDEEIAEFDSDKATLEFPSPAEGKLIMVAKEGDDLAIGDLVCRIDTSVVKEKSASSPEPGIAVADKDSLHAKPDEKQKPEPLTALSTQHAASNTQPDPTPVAANMMVKEGISNSQITGTGANGRITKSDVVNFLKSGGTATVEQMSTVLAGQQKSREQRTEKMSRLRKTIAKRLVAVKNETAMLTTFNDVNMKPVMDIRTKYKAKFEEKHGIRLGFMSFFIKACANALTRWPAVNAYIDEGNMIFNDFVDISIAVSTPKGLVVPVVRNCETLSMAQMESEVRRLAKAGRDGDLSLEEMTGGTFTITNGGVFGSLLSTPIINSPQSAILGMHRIEERPVVENGEVVVRPMMYLALSYDHRIIDGRESVGFLVDVKEQLQNPEQLLLGEDPVEVLLGL